MGPSCMWLRLQKNYHKVSCREVRCTGRLNRGETHKNGVPVGDIPVVARARRQWPLLLLKTYGAADVTLTPYVSLPYLLFLVTPRLCGHGEPNDAVESAFVAGSFQQQQDSVRRHSLEARTPGLGHGYASACFASRHHPSDHHGRNGGRC